MVPFRRPNELQRVLIVITNERSMMYSRRVVNDDLARRWDRTSLASFFPFREPCLDRYFSSLPPGPFPFSSRLRFFYREYGLPHSCPRRLLSLSISLYRLISILWKTRFFYPGIKLLHFFWTMRCNIQKRANGCAGRVGKKWSVGDGLLGMQFM